MEQEPLPPIPSPFGSRWRFDYPRLVHVVVFLVACGLATLLWTRVQGPGAFVGQVEVMQFTVASRDAGYITNLFVRPLQPIQAGDPVAEIVTTDPRTVNNRLEAMRDRMRLTALELDPILRRERWRDRNGKCESLLKGSIRRCSIRSIRSMQSDGRAICVLGRSICGTYVR